MRALGACQEDVSDAALTPACQASRSSLVAAAEQVFTQDGFHDAKVVDIARLGGVTYSSFYRHFGSKEEIFLEVTRLAAGRLWEPVDVDANDFVSSAAVESGVRRHLLRYLDAYDRYAAILSLIGEIALFDARVNAVMLAAQRQNRERCVWLIKMAQDRGLADPRLNPDVAYLALDGTLHELAGGWLGRRTMSFELEVFVQEMTTFVVRSLGLRNLHA
ncbi:TetR/AcrR family transcriptional regulator [Pseudofrankia inefficax]|uniref:Regulatory protein TetR n=1 Tax=Pseudofrankia inefficax (strain DSM 45817 / CECT 9037 / DDB 130130 / EuI1c) TaxID=298654 RepID=E3J9P7_PSEI1|nr:TetR/AcrR family transcriptional regulator [Pseudofrankia inefficax]ADP84550.1 regulatory protein TetR [Pseudofrankia inefficax]